MAQLPDQEIAEYYNWLFKIEAWEFKKELLEIVSSISFLMRKTKYRPSIVFFFFIINNHNCRVSGIYFTHQMKQHKLLPTAKNI